MKPTCVVGLLSLALAIVAGRAGAGSYVETADAGQVPATAENVTVSGAIDVLTGRVEHAFDADLFRLLVVDPEAFSAAAIPTAAGAPDLQLFAFDAWGHGLAANDDWLRSPLPQFPAGTFSGRQPGVFLLGIAPSDSDPIGIFGEIFSDADAGVSIPEGLSRIDTVLGWSLDFTATGGNYLITLTGAAGLAPVLIGDYNANGSVDVADYVVWRNTLGQTGTALPADGDGDGDVDGNDRDVWRTHFGQAATSGVSNQAVPETASHWFVVLGLLVCSTKIRRRGLGPIPKLSRRGGQSQFAPRTPQIRDSPRQFWDRSLVFFGKPDFNRSPD